MRTSPSAPSQRLFLALWPDDGTRELLAAWQRTWTWTAAPKLVPPERLHLTLHFLGNVAAARVPELGQRLHVSFEPFEIVFEHAGVWPGGIAVLRPGVIPPPLAQLQGRLGRALLELGLPVEERPYRPHVTLARRANGAVPAPPPAPVAWRAADGYVLVRSVGNGGAYEIIRRFR